MKTLLGCLLLGLSPVMPPHIPTPGVTSFLFGATCVTRADCWAVGDYGTAAGAFLNQVLHWNGTSWSQVPAPNPGGAGSDGRNDLAAIACTSARNCWSVGSYIRNHTTLGEALHWNGRRWSAVAIPGFGFSEFTAVRCASVSECLAFGDEAANSGTAPSFNLVLHWTGTKWVAVRVPSPGGSGPGAFSIIEGASCASSGDCWAVGVYGHGAVGSPTLNQALHWNGRLWSVVSAPNPAGTGTGADNRLNSVFCTGARSCYAVGFAGIFAGHTSTLVNEVLHWNGRKWAKTAVPDPDGTATGAHNLLSAVTCTSDANCWAVGEYGTFTTGSGAILNQMLRWNGHRWSPFSVPNPGGMASGDQSFLEAVRCASATLCWALGAESSSTQPRQNEALRWGGSHWRVG